MYGKTSHIRADFQAKAKPLPIEPMGERMESTSIPDIGVDTDIAVYQYNGANPDV